MQKDGRQIDEIEEYQIGRCVSTGEAIWQILPFPIHEGFPQVIHLHIYLENGQRVYFTNENAAEKAAHAPKTTLTSIFLLCQKDDFAKTLLFKEVPQYHTWNASNREWKRRLSGIVVLDQVGVKSCGRKASVHPRNDEYYYLRLLLHTVRDATSFEAIRTTEGHTLDTYREACDSLGLLENDQQWHNTMREAVLCKSHCQTRNVSVLLLYLWGVSDPVQLWENCKEGISRRLFVSNATTESENRYSIYNPNIFTNVFIVLWETNFCLYPERNHLIRRYLFPKLNRSNNRFVREILLETNYNQTEMENIVLDLPL